MMFSGSVEQRVHASCADRRSRIGATALLLLFLGAHLVVLTWLGAGAGLFAPASLWTVLPFYFTPPRHGEALSPETW